MLQQCVHHWLLETEEVASYGTCNKCGVRRYFTGGIDSVRVGTFRGYANQDIQNMLLEARVREERGLQPRFVFESTPPSLNYYQID